MDASVNVGRLIQLEVNQKKKKSKKLNIIFLLICDGQIETHSIADDRRNKA